MPGTRYFNGVDAETGGYAFPPAPVGEIARMAEAGVAAFENAEPGHLGDLNRRNRALNTPDYAPVEGVDPKDLAQTGWGIIFAHDAGPALKEALKPLLDLRRAQASRIKESRYRELTGGSGGESKPEFLDRNKAGGGGAVDPDQIPYYLLIAGSPESIPFDFQYQLDVQYAVGRICFNSLDDLCPLRPKRGRGRKRAGQARPARGVLGVANPGDPATNMSASELVAPLAKLVQDDQPAWKVDTIAPADAMKNRLAQLMGGPDTPALLFTASHGMLFGNGSPLQAEHNGALLCGNWPGPSVKGPVPPDWYFSGCDLSSDAELLGLIAFHFACFSAATPQYDDFTPADQSQPKVIAPRPFVANLPQRLLAHPRGGALASIGHVDRAWSCSFNSANGDAQLRVFKSMLKRLMEGHPVGSAMEYFNNRHAELSCDLSATVRSIKYGKRVHPADLTDQWTFNNDARNYVIIGDPAVRLAVTGDPMGQRKSAIEAVPIGVRSTPAPAAPAPGGPGATVDSSGSDAKSTLRELAATLSAKIGEVINAVSTVQVKTYSTASLTGEPGADPFAGATLRAVSEIRLDGNARICVPETEGQLDVALWKLHTDMVEKALANRVEMLKLAAAAASSLLGALKQP